MLSNGFEPVTLKGKILSLVPLSETHHDDLVEATQDEELWKLWYTFVPSPEIMLENIHLRLSMQVQGTMIPFAAIKNTSQKHDQSA